jgi:hypothetical protein
MTIFKKSIRRLGGRTNSHQFSSVDAGMEKMDRLLEQGKPVGMVGNVYYLDYLPEIYRFHFTGHNLVVYTEKDGAYEVSDPLLEDVSSISAEKLKAARFSPIFPRTRGRLYYIEDVGHATVTPAGVIESINEVCYNMVVPPIPWIGCRGIQTLAKRIARYPRQYPEKDIVRYLSNIVQMQEVIGTGGAASVLCTLPSSRKQRKDSTIRLYLQCRPD